MEPYFARRVNAGTTPSGENTTNTTTKSNNTNTEKDDAGEEEEEETRLADAVDDAKEEKKSSPPPEVDQLFLQGSRERLSQGLPESLNETVNGFRFVGFFSVAS